MDTFKYYASVIDGNKLRCCKMCEDLNEAISYVKHYGSESVIYRLEDPLFCHFVDGKLFVD